MKASRLSNPLERREQPEVVEFVPKQELDRARRQIERLQKENERLKQESERLRHERTAGQSAAGGAALPWRTQEQLQAARSQPGGDYGRQACRPIPPRIDDIDFRTHVIRVTRKPLYGFKRKNKEQRDGLVRCDRPCAGSRRCPP